MQRAPISPDLEIERVAVSITEPEAGKPGQARSTGRSSATVCCNDGAQNLKSFSHRQRERTLRAHSFPKRLARLMTDCNKLAHSKQATFTCTRPVHLSFRQLSGP